MPKPGKGDKFSSPKPQAEDESWMASFADMVTLLLVFFILLVSMSKIDTAKFEEVSAGMTKSLSDRKVETPIEELRQQLKDSIQSTRLEGAIAIGKDSAGVSLEMAATSFYEAGSAEIREDALEMLQHLAETIAMERYNGFQIDVEGHTDDTPVSTPEFPTNWELSAARAARVVRFLENEGIAPSRMRAVGLADTAPKVPNRDPFGAPLAQNQEVNRRVVVRLHPR